MTRGRGLERPRDDGDNCCGYTMYALKNIPQKKNSCDERSTISSKRSFASCERMLCTWYGISTARGTVRQVCGVLYDLKKDAYVFLIGGEKTPESCETQGGNTWHSRVVCQSATK